MMGYSFKEQIKRNDLLDKYSRIMDTMYFHILDGDKTIALDMRADSYCEINLLCSEILTNISIKINNQILLTIDNAGQYNIPIILTANDKIVLSGSGKGILLGLVGGKFGNNKVCKILPNINKYISYEDDAKVYSYSTVEDILDTQLTFDGEIGNCKYVGEFVHDNNYFIGKIDIGNGVYFSTSMNNYTDKFKILNEEPKDIIYKQDIVGNMIVFMYILGARVYADIYSLDGLEILDTYEISPNSIKVPKSLTTSECNGDMGRVFSIVYENDSIDVMYLRSYANIEKIAEFTGNNVKIIEKKDSATLIVKNNYTYDIMNATLNISSYGCNILKVLSNEKINNIVECFVLGNDRVYVSTGLCLWKETV